MKKILSFTLLASLLFVLAACTNRTNETESHMSDRQQALGFSALSSVLALHNEATVSTQQASQTEGFTLLEATPSLMGEYDAIMAFLEDIDGLRPFLDLVNSFMGGQNDGFQVDIDASTEDGYAYTMLIQTLNIEGVRVTYALHYNETRVEIDDDDDGEITVTLVRDGQTDQLFFRYVIVTDSGTTVRYRALNPSFPANTSSLSKPSNKHKNSV